MAAFFFEAVSPRYDRREAEQLFSLLLDHYLSWTPVDFYLKGGQKPEGGLSDQITAVIDPLLKNRPIQYILGCAHFCGLKLKVDENVLIPRPETEELVAEILSREGLAARSVLDIGTGSGALALALQSNRPTWEVVGIDVAAGALQCARKNAEAHGLSVTFRHLDIRETSRWESEAAFDVLVSNPPYIQEAEKAQMEPRVLDYEPHLALFVPPDRPLYFYELIADFAQLKCKPGGTLYCELNPNLASEILELLRQKGFETALQKDLSGKDRFLIAERLRQPSVPRPK